jgi:hypothetical protein
MQDFPEIRSGRVLLQALRLGSWFRDRDGIGFAGFCRSERNDLGWKADQKKGQGLPPVPRSKTIIFGRKRQSLSLIRSKTALYKAHRLARLAPTPPKASYVHPAFVSAAVTIPHSRSLSPK